MEFKITRVFEENLAAFLHPNRRIAINQGGTSSGKTWSILQLLIYIATISTRPLTISVVSESLPHLKRGVIRDFENILGVNYDSERMNKSDHIYTFGRAKIEFFPADESSKLRGGRRDILFVNEANNITRDSFNELSVRTRRFIFIDFNPVYEFWAHALAMRGTSQFIKSTYKDAIMYLPKEIVEDIESRRETDPNWWRVYGEGEIGGVENLVYTNYEIIHDENWPVEFDDHCYGCDFGFNNPTGLVHVGIKDGEPWIEELLYKRKITNEELIREMADLEIDPHYPIYCDSAEPARIASIAESFWAVGATNAKKSVVDRISFCKSKKMHVRASSLNMIKELRNYMYKKNAQGTILEEPVKEWDHLINAAEYAMFEHCKRQPLMVFS